LIDYQVIAWYLLGIQYSAAHTSLTVKGFAGATILTGLLVSLSSFFSSFMMISWVGLKNLGEMRDDAFSSSLLAHFSSYFLMGRNCIWGRLSFLVAFHKDWFQQVGSVR